eukprot:s5_g2.t1
MSGLAKQGPRVAHLSAQALQASWLLDGSPSWLQCAEITARRLLDYGPASRRGVARVRGEKIPVLGEGAPVWHLCSRLCDELFPTTWAVH